MSQYGKFDVYGMPDAYAFDPYDGDALVFLETPSNAEWPAALDATYKKMAADYQALLDKVDGQLAAMYGLYPTSPTPATTPKPPALYDRVKIYDQYGQCWKHGTVIGLSTEMATVKFTNSGVLCDYRIATCWNVTLLPDTDSVILPPKSCKRCGYENTYGAPGNQSDGTLLCSQCRLLGGA